MAIRTDQYANSLTVVDTVSANANLSLVPQGTGAVTIPGTGQNLILYSEQFQQASWSKNGSIITADAIASPTGTVTADKIIGATGILTRKCAFEAFTPINGSKYTFSVYLKAAERTTATIWLDSTGWAEGSYYGAAALLDLSTGVSSVPAQVSMTAVGNGWYRCVVTGTSTSNASCNVTVAIGPANGGDYTGNNIDGIYAWGAQVELAPAVGPYIVTTTTAIYGTPLLSFAGVANIGLQSDGSVYVQPAGTGALQAQATTSTATGGNARGANAVDWQTSRASASQVASATYSVIAGGQYNTANQSISVVGGGALNTASGYAGVVGGGYNNTTGGNYCFIGSGQSNQIINSNVSANSFIGAGTSNVAHGAYNFVGGGFTNAGTSASAVTTQSATMNGTTAVTLAASNASIKVGQYITGTSIASETYVAAVSGTSLTLSKVASGSSTSTLSFYTPHGVVVGGGNNQATGSYSFIGGGGDAGTAANRNVASGAWSFVGGGRSNTASGTGSFIGGGGTWSNGASIGSNTASGEGTVITGGASNNNSGFLANISGGYANTLTGSGAIISGGWSNTSNSSFGTVIGGTFATTRSITGNTVFSGCQTPIASSLGVSQSAMLVLGKQTTDATATVLTSDGSAAGTTNQVILPNNSAYYFRGEVVSGVTGGGDSKGWRVEGLIKRGASAAATTLVGSTVTSSYADAGASTWAIALSADTTNGGLAVTFTGQAGTTIRCVAKIETTEMTY